MFELCIFWSSLDLKISKLLINMFFCCSMGGGGYKQSFFRNLYLLILAIKVIFRHTNFIITGLWVSEYCFTSLSAQSWQYSDRRKPEIGTMTYAYSYQITSRVLYSTSYQQLDCNYLLIQCIDYTVTECRVKCLWSTFCNLCPRICDTVDTYKYP